MRRPTRHTVNVEITGSTPVQSAKSLAIERGALLKNMLTQKQETFCLKYFELGNASEAAVIAGYSPKYAATHTTRWLRMANIKARLDELRQKVEDAAIMNKQEILKKHSIIGRAAITDFQTLGADGSYVDVGPENEHAGAVQEITSRTEYAEDSSHSAVISKVKLHDPIKSMQEIAKLRGYYPKEGTGEGSTDNRTINIIVSSEKAKELTENVSRRLLQAPGSKSEGLLEEEVVND